jgi:hypothetical protein
VLSVTRTVTSSLPRCVGVQEIRPVTELTVMPGGAMSSV